MKSDINVLLRAHPHQTPMQLIVLYQELIGKMESNQMWGIPIPDDGVGDSWSERITEAEEIIKALRNA